MSRVGGKIRVGRITPIQQFFFFLALLCVQIFYYVFPLYYHPEFTVKRCLAIEQLNSHDWQFFTL